MSLRDFAIYVYSAFTKLWNRIFTDEARLSALEGRVAKLEQQNTSIPALGQELKSATDALAESERNSV